MAAKKLLNNGNLDEGRFGSPCARGHPNGGLGHTATGHVNVDRHRARCDGDDGRRAAGINFLLVKLLLDNKQKIE